MPPAEASTDADTASAHTTGPDTDAGSGSDAGSRRGPDSGPDCEDTLDLKLPEEISKVEGPRDTNMFQVEPTMLDERYIRSGRAEKTLQLPGVLPPDAPIPDNK